MSLPSPTISTSSGTPRMDPKQLEAMDAPLIALANQSGGDLRKLLYAFFSFLHRRTDFYLVPPLDDDDGNLSSKMGFREGDAEKLLLAAFRQFPLRRIPKEPPKRDGKSTSAVAASAAEAKTSTTTNSPSATATAATNESNTSKQESSSASPPETEPTSEIRRTDEGLQIPVGNGGVTERYRWTQTLDECTVLLAVPKDTKGKDLVVTIKPSSISIQLKKQQQQTILLEGKLHSKIRVDESTWSLEGGVLLVTLDKLQKTFWETILDGDDKIDTSLVDSRRHIDTYDEATQAQLRKMIFDQSQERRGLPTSDELSGKTPKIPPLPPGVEYIDQQVLDNAQSEKATGGGTK